jgi:hypothetical protein
VKCIRCGVDCKYKDRPDGRCPQCKGHFAFEPKSGDKFTDAAFAAAIDRVSSQGHVRFGAEHVYYELCRKVGKYRLKLPIFVIFAMIALVVITANEAWLVLPVWLAGCVLGLVSNRRKYAGLSMEDFETMFARWCGVHGRPKGIILPKRETSGPQPLAAEPDLADYSFDRAVICDRSRTVDLLLANRFHFENNCAVLSIEGYPPHAFATVRAMLKRNPKLVVFALHDASAEGCRLADRLSRDPDWFQGSARVVDVGLTPAHARHLKGLWLPASATPSTALTYPKRDVAWLAAHALELAAIRPEQVIKRLFKALSAQTDHPDVAPASGDAIVDSVSFAGDASSSDGGGDSFG